MLLLPEKLRDKIVAHAHHWYPRECCGALLGSFGQVRTIRQVLPLENEEPADKALYRYSIASTELFRLHQAATRTRTAIIGFFHSHPMGSVHPSETDRRLAWHEYSYLIVSLIDQANPHLRAWRLENDSAFFREEEIVNLQAQPI